MHSGACYVRYDLVWTTILGSVMFKISRYNIDKMEEQEEQEEKQSQWVPFGF